MDAYLISLAKEYLDLISAMSSGQHATDELHELSAQRSLVHDELIRLTGHERPFDMKQYARSLVSSDKLRVLFVEEVNHSPLQQGACDEGSNRHGVD